MKTLLYFTGPTCSKCKVVGSWWNEFVAGNTWLNFRVIDTGESLDEARKYSVTSLPGFVLVDEQGETLYMKLGDPSRGALERKLDLFR